MSFMRSQSCAKRHFNKSVILVLKTRYVKDDTQEIVLLILKACCVKRYYNKCLLLVLR